MDAFNYVYSFSFELLPPIVIGSSIKKIFYESNKMI